MSAVSLPINALLYVPIRPKTVITVFLLSYGLLQLFYRNHVPRQQQTNHTVEVTLSEQTVIFQAMRDTGNELYDPFSNRPVLLCEPEILSPLFPDTSLDTDDPFALYCSLTRIPHCTTRMKLIPYRTISDSGMVAGFVPDSVTIDNIHTEHIIAFCPNQFHHNSPYQGIF